MSKYAKLEHEGDEFFDDKDFYYHDTRETVDEIERIRTKVELEIVARAKRKAQERWLSPENPYIWTPVLID